MKYMDNWEKTKKKREKYSWQPYVDKELQIPCTIAAKTQKLELREYLSEVLRKEVFGEQTDGI